MLQTGTETEPTEEADSREQEEKEPEEDRFTNDPLLTAYVSSQAGWSEEVAEHWTNKRVKMLSKMFSRCAGPDVKTSVEALTTTAVMDAIEDELKATSKTQPALCKSKSVALVQFCRFAHGRLPEARPALKSAISRAEEWKVKASKEDKKREAKLQGQMSDESYLPGKEELKEFRERLDKELQKFLQGEKKPNYTNAVTLRRVLEAKICLLDFNRAGPLVNAKMSEYESMERMADGKAVLSVEKHKSSATHGPANLPLSQDIVQALDVYVQTYRPMLGGVRDSDKLFRCAKPHHDLKQLAMSYGMEVLSKKLTPTMLRKVAGTSARSALPEPQCEQLANLMCHLPETQRRHYAAKQRKTSNIEVASLMADKLFGAGSPSDTQEDIRTPEEDSRTPEEDSRTPEKDSRTPEEERRTPEEERRTPEEERRTPEDDSWTPKNKTRLKKGRNAFKREEMEALSNAADEASVPLTVRQVVSLKKKYPVLAGRGTKVIYNKLRELLDCQNRTRAWIKKHMGHE